MKVLFIKDAPGGIKQGQVKDVSDGYAQNFLLPKGFVQMATPQLQAKLNKEAKEAEAKQKKEHAKLETLKAEMEKKEFSVKVKVGDKGQVFGGVYEKDVAKVISDKLAINIDRRQIEIPGVIRGLGEHQAKLRLGNGITATLKINVQAN